MLPGSSSADSRNARPADVIASGYIAVQFSIFASASDVQYVDFCKFSRWPALSTSVCSVPLSVVLIAGRCIPAKVFNAVIRTVAVIVTALHPEGPRTNERLQNNDVDVVCRDFSLFAKANVPITVGCGALSENSARDPSPCGSEHIDLSAMRPSTDTSRLPFVGRLVESFEARNVSPFGGIFVRDHAANDAAFPAPCQPVLGR